jgi:hypothetical protein
VDKSPQHPPLFEILSPNSVDNCAKLWISARKLWITAEKCTKAVESLWILWIAVLWTTTCG